jgi:hypothetical protein
MYYSKLQQGISIVAGLEDEWVEFFLLQEYQMATEGYSNRS